MLNTFLKTKLNENKYLILGHLTFFALLIFSIIFAKERVIYVDSAAQIFGSIEKEGFEIFVQRYSMYLFQLLPVLAIKLHLPLSVVVYSYSISAPVIGYLLWLITVYFLKDQKAGIFMLFVMLGISQTFFHAISETFQLMFLASFLYAWLFQTRNSQTSVLSKAVYYLIASLFIALCIFIHPVAIFFIAFILGIYILDKNISIPQKIMVSVISVGVILLKFLTATEGNHDEQFMISASEFLHRTYNLFTHYTTFWFFKHFTNYYWMPFLMMLASVFIYWKKKKYWHLAFVPGFVTLFWVITVVIYAPGDSDIAMERSFLPLFFFCGVPFVTEVFPLFSSKWDKVFCVGLTVLLFAGFTKIATASRPFTQRLEKIEEISVMANQQNKKKILIEEETARQIFPIINWGLGFESLIYTAMKGVDSTVNMYMVKDTIDLTDPHYPKFDVYFAVPWWIYRDASALNPHYFKLPEQQPSVLVLEEGALTIKDLSF
jgi:hypothetical protein